MASLILNSNTSTMLATAMAVSGTVILLALRLQKSHIQTVPCTISSDDNDDDGKKREKKKKKRVQFADDVVDPTGNSEEFRRRRRRPRNDENKNYDINRNKMQGNRRALYNGILQDRLLHRVAYSY